MPDTDDPTGNHTGDSTQHFPAPQPPGGGWIIGERYRVTGRIGAGGMAEVFRARDQLLDRDVAVKVFRTAASADTAAGAERQRAEIHALARLNHPNLITLYDGAIAAPDDTQSQAYLVMELVEGPNLGDRIEQGPLPTEPEVRVIGAQVADALSYVHAQGMVHRDVKPANILLGAGTGSDHVRARLSDFGIVRLVGAERMTQADLTLGTASYLAPEQARGSAVGPPADVYALGLTLIEALTGVRSFDAPTPLEAVLARLDRDPAIPPNLPEPWPALLAAMTSRDPARRPNARQVSNALRGGDTTAMMAAAGGAAGTTGSTTVIPAVAPMPPVRPPRDTGYVPLTEPVSEPKPRNTGLIVGLVLAAVLLVIGAIIVVATTSGDDGSGGTTTTPSSSASTSGASTSPSTRQRSSSSEQTQQPSDDETQQPSDEQTTPTRTRTRSSSSAPETTPSTSPPTSSSPTTSDATTSTPAAAGPGNGGPGAGGPGAGGPGNGGPGNGP